MHARRARELNSGVERAIRPQPFLAPLMRPTQPEPDPLFQLQD